MPALRSHRVIQLAARAVPWTLGSIVLALRHPAAELRPAAHCAGLLDLVAIAIAGRWPDLQVGTLVTGLRVVTMTVALGCVATLAIRATHHVPSAIAAALALGLSVQLPLLLAPPWEAAAFGASAAAFLAVGRAADRNERSTWSLVGAWTALLLAASTVPAWTIASAVAAGVLVWRGVPVVRSPWRGVTAAAAVASIFLAAITILHTAPPIGGAPTWSACLFPSIGTGDRIGELVGVMLRTGPVVLALAALGFWVAVPRAGARRSIVLVLLLALAIVAGSHRTIPPVVYYAPVLVAIWWGAAIGLREIARQMGSGRRAKLGAAAALVLMPLLQWSVVRADGHDEIARPLGHDRASLSAIRLLLNLVPDGSTLVEEDATADLLIRADFLRRRSPKPVTMLPAARPGVQRAFASGPVYALPSGQRTLGLLGFTIEPVTDPREPSRPIPGLARVTGMRRCVEPAAQWVDVAGVGSSGRIALSAASETAEGPVVVYFAAAPGDALPRPDGWPAAAERGFHVNLFSRATLEDAGRLEVEAAQSGAGDHAVFAAKSVVRLTLYRVPGAPLTLPIVLGSTQGVGVARLLPAYEGALPLTLCDAPNVDVSRF